MAFWILNKQTGEPKVYGSLPLVSEYTSLNYKSLLYIFSQKGDSEFENDDYRICKVEYERGGKGSIRAL
tara:strand:+ start:427 stop:633 length:207 start_codon:yes stop_codon:yes gene_type:complete